MTPQPTVSDERTATRTSRGATVAASAGLGVLAAAISYLLTYLLIGGEVRDAVGGEAPVWKGVAWYFYNAHLVEIEASGSIGAVGSTETVNFIAESGAATADLLYATPPVVLLGTGALLAVRLDAGDLGEAAVVGAPVTVGYAAVAGLGALVSEAGTESSFFGVEIAGSIAPPFVPALVLGGVLYPLVFATGGAVLAVVFADR